MFNRHGKQNTKRYFSLLNMVAGGMCMTDWSMWYEKHSIDFMPSVLCVRSRVRPPHTHTCLYQFTHACVCACMHDPSTFSLVLHTKGSEEFP